MVLASFNFQQRFCCISCILYHDAELSSQICRNCSVDSFDVEIVIVASVAVIAASNDMERHTVVQLLNKVFLLMNDNKVIK